MDFTPPRRLGLTLGAGLMALLLGALGLSVQRLAAAEVSPWLLLWVILPLLSLPMLLAVGYRIYGLLTARYHLDRDGFSLTWGLAYEQVPLSQITQVARVSLGALRLRPSFGLWWPGCLVGKGRDPELGATEFFATQGSEGMVLLRAQDRTLVISPADPEAFEQAFVAATRMGSLEPIPAVSRRPDFVVARLWADRMALGLLLAGLGLSLALLGYLALRAPNLPPMIPFGFDVSGLPGALAPPGRLLLLPLIGGLTWFVDLVLGAWMYASERDRPLAYGLWGTALLTGALLWGAALHMLAAA